MKRFIGLTLGLCLLFASTASAFTYSVVADAKGINDQLPNQRLMIFTATGVADAYTTGGEPVTLTSLGLTISDLISCSSDQAYILSVVDSAVTVYNDYDTTNDVFLQMINGSTLAGDVFTCTAIVY